MTSSSVGGEDKLGAGWRMTVSAHELARAVDEVIWSGEIEPAPAEPALRVLLRAQGVALRDILAELSDESLAQAYRRGLFCHPAFEELLVNRSERPLRVWFYKRTQNLDRSQELLQEFYVKLLTTNALARYDPEYPFRPWFWRVVQNFWFGELRRRQQGISSTSLLSIEPTRQPGPVEEVLARELQEQLDEAVSLLPEEEREVILRTSNGEKASQIAQELNLPLSHVYRLHFRARRAIEHRLNLS